jgi:hypothetical protein
MHFMKEQKIDGPEISMADYFALKQLLSMPSTSKPQQLEVQRMMRRMDDILPLKSILEMIKNVQNIALSLSFAQSRHKYKKTELGISWLNQNGLIKSQEVQRKSTTEIMHTGFVDREKHTVQKATDCTVSLNYKEAKLLSKFKGFMYGSNPLSTISVGSHNFSSTKYSTKNKLEIVH